MMMMILTSSLQVTDLKIEFCIGIRHTAILFDYALNFTDLQNIAAYYYFLRRRSPTVILQ